MKLKRQIGTLAVLAVGSLALAAPAVSATPDRTRDAHDRGAAVAYFHANELATLAASSRVHTLRDYVDAPERGGASQTVSSGIVATSEDRFDWRAAAIGATSALMLFLVAVLGVTAARHSRARPLAR